MPCEQRHPTSKLPKPTVAKKSKGAKFQRQTCLTGRQLPSLCSQLWALGSAKQPSILSQNTRDDQLMTRKVSCGSEFKGSLHDRLALCLRVRGEAAGLGKSTRHSKAAHFVASKKEKEEGARVPQSSSRPHPHDLRTSQEAHLLKVPPPPNGAILGPSSHTWTFGRHSHPNYSRR